jgi:glycine cleavage system H protein
MKGVVEYRGCELPEDLYYDLDYIWVKPETGDRYRIGITDPSQTMAGRVQYVSIREVGTRRPRKKPVARLESGKWAGGIPAPFDGVIVERNQRVVDDPNLVNIAPYTEAWLVVMQPDDPAHALDHLATGTEAIAKLKAWIDRYDVQCMRCAT